VSVNPKTAQLDLQHNRQQANWFMSLSKELEESLRERYKIVTKNWFLPKQMRYTEVVIAQDAEVFVVGECETKDGQAALVNKDNRVMLTFRKEETVLRNGKIALTIFKGLAIAIPIVFVGLAIFAYFNLPQGPGSQNPNPPPAAKQNQPPKANTKTGRPK
jgi:hypothetical protein